MKTKKIIIYLSIIFVSLIGTLTKASDNNNQRDFNEATNLLEIWFQSVIDYDRIPGISISVIHDQEIVYKNGFGYIDDNQNVKATPGTIYSICSITKLFTSTAIMQLRDAGKLKLYDPIVKYLRWFTPEMVNTDDPPPTIRDLLRHSSGLPCEPDKTIWSKHDQLYPSHEELMKRVKSLKMSYPTNTEFNYSNLGYALLGEIISKVSGMEYSDYIQKNILDPIDMKKTMPFIPKDLVGSDLAIGYSKKNRKGPRTELANSDSKTFGRTMIAAGGYSSTVEDMAKLAMWNFRVLDGIDNKILSKETLLEMQTAQWDNPKWGLGYAIWNLGEKDIFGHYGGCSYIGYKSQIIICPEDKIAVVVMINTSDAPQWSLAFSAYEVLAPALINPKINENNLSKWSNFTGYYSSDKVWSDIEVLEWNDSLAVMWVPAYDPIKSLTMLTRIEGNVFRQVKNDGKLGKHYIFGADDEGNIVSMKFNNNILKKLN